jgi:hypothetical protein
MIRTSLLSILLAASLLTAACGRTPLTDTGLKGESSIATVRDLASAYERRDIDGFMEKVSPAYPDRAAFQKSIEKVFGDYQTIHFNVLYNRMLITVQYQENIKVTFTWEGEWRTSGGKVVKDGAQVSMILSRTTFKLSNIEGKDPFVPSETQIPLR